MLKILMAEIKYFKLPLLVIFALPLIFTVAALNDILLFEQVYFLKKYFWSVFVGLGTYALIIIIWSLRKKEIRERVHAALPVSVGKLAVGRWIFAVSPFLIVGFYVELLRCFIPVRQIIFIDRINGQLGMLFLALAAVDLAMNSWSALEFKRYDKRLFFTGLISAALLISGFGVIYLASASIIQPLSPSGDENIFLIQPQTSGGEEILFFVWGTVLSVIDLFVFKKRKSFLT
ncbi:MAG: hypothetical protein GXO87_04390 [Chlorobi bacterium]|nr:hypothetical protein [Chlorobiota bacterium]